MDSSESPEQLLQHQPMELRDIQLPLAIRQVRQRLLHRLRPGLQQIGAVAQNGNEGRVVHARFCKPRGDLGGICRTQLLDLEEWDARSRNVSGRKPSRSKTTRCVGRMSSPSLSMFTKVIITAASG